MRQVRHGGEAFLNRWCGEGNLDRRSDFPHSRLAFWVPAKVPGMLRSLALALGLGIESALRGVLLDVAAIAVVLAVCLLASFPGYAVVKGLAENVQQSEQIANSFVPFYLCSANTGGSRSRPPRARRDRRGVPARCAKPRSGNVVFVSAERVRKLPVPVTEALKILRTLGIGSEPIAAACRGHAPGVPDGPSASATIAESLWIEPASTGCGLERQGTYES